jgi:hypothetical protein
VRREWELEDLIECWTLDEEDVRLLANKSGATRLGFALTLKYFEQEGRFPRRAADIPEAVVGYVAGQAGVAAGEFAAYDWSGRTVKNHRAQIRDALGFREPTVGDEDKLADWLAAEVCTAELNRDRLRAALCHVRQAELTDGLVDLLIELVHRISVRAERKVENELSSEFRRVHGKQGILFKLAAAAVDHPDELVRAALYPVVGEATLRDLVAEARANERAFSTRVRVQLRSSYSHHYRRGLPSPTKRCSPSRSTCAGRK